ncbi:MAG: dihydrodipicolinate synthase family protein [Actinomycetota bacterium]
MTELRGTWFVVPTAFDEAGDLDGAGQRRLVEAVVSWDVDGLTAMGVTGEAAALTPDERHRALEAIFEGTAGRVPIVVGCSGGHARVAIDLAGRAAALGAAAVMVSAPPLHRDLESLPAFFAQVAEGVDVPVVIQDEPAATGVRIPVGLLLACLEAAGSRTVKLEDPPTPPKIARLLAADAGLRVFGGLGGASALGELRRGACGTMTGFAFPEILRAVRQAVNAGEPGEAARIFDRYLPLIQLEGQPGIGLAIRKELLRRRGALPSPTSRLARPLAEDTIRDIDDTLGRLGIRPGPAPLAVDR